MHRRRIWSLVGIGVPVNTIQVSSASEVGRQQVRKIGSAPVAMSIPCEENPNFATRARIFADSWNYDNAQWEGDVTIPVEVGPHRPFSTKKAVRTKFIPYIGTEQLRFEWKTNRAEFDSGEATDHMPVAKMLFEQSNRVHQAARDAPINRFVGETEPFSLWFADDHVFMIVNHDGSLVLGQESTGFRNHQDVCARFPPGSTMEFDAAQFEAAGQITSDANGAVVRQSFAANWVSHPYKVFRVQDCTLGAVGGMFGRTGVVSASTNVAATTGMAAGAAKYSSYFAFLGKQAAAQDLASMNSTHTQGAAHPNTFYPAAHGAAIPTARSAQIGRALCERASVVIFTKDSFTMLKKQDHQPAEITTRAQAYTFMARTGANQDFDDRVYPQAYFITRRYKTAIEAAASDVTDIPEELYGQVIAVELCRGGHQALFGVARNQVDGLAGAIAPTLVAPGHNANIVAASDTCFQGRFEAREGELPPSMTIDANGAVTAMTNANISLSGAVHADTGLAGRWDTWEVVRYAAYGYGGGADRAIRSQLSSGMTTLTTGYNAMGYNAAVSTDAVMPSTEDGLVPADAFAHGQRLCPTHSKGRARYILTPSGPTSASSRNDLGTRTAANYVNDVEASNCYAKVAEYESRIPSGAVPIKKVYMSWRDQGPHLLCEWAVLKQVSPVYNLYYPQFESFRDNNFDNTAIAVQQGYIRDVRIAQFVRVCRANHFGCAD